MADRFIVSSLRILVYVELFMRHPASVMPDQFKFLDGESLAHTVSVAFQLPLDEI